jgi:hypothetical protein
LLDAAEAKFDIIVTTDQNLRYQQNLTNRKLSILVLSTTNWLKIEAQAEQVVTALDALKPGEIVRVEFS